MTTSPDNENTPDFGVSPLKSTVKSLICLRPKHNGKRSREDYDEVANPAK